MRALTALRLLTALLVLTTIASLPLTASAQVHYFEGGRPWNQRARRGPDAEVDGWYYNLGVTGLRARLSPEHPEQLWIRHVFDGSPAAGKIHRDDWIVGAGGKRFETPHQNGYGMKVFGAEGPIEDFAEALEESLGSDGKLRLRVRRGDDEREIVLRLGKKLGRLSPTFPENCRRSDRVLAALCDYLVKHQRDDGSWGSPPHDTFAPLALLATDRKKYAKQIEKNARYHARTTRAVDSSWLINWRYMAAAIVLSEVHVATGEKWILPELEEIRDFLVSSQYVDLSQIDEKSKKERPGDMPKDPMDSHGGWGHNPGFEGYGPISMLTGQGALAFAMMHRCGIAIDRERHDAAYAFLKRGSGPNGYTWYEDQVAGARNWADMGRTGALGIAHWLSPYSEPEYKKQALSHAECIGEHPESFPDTHGSPVMGMGYAAVAALVEPTRFRQLMDSNRWWFTLAQCGDGSYYYQPNRDNAGYGNDSRISASAVTAFILALPRRNLLLSREETTGKR